MADQGTGPSPRPTGGDEFLDGGAGSLIVVGRAWLHSRGRGEHVGGGRSSGCGVGTGTPRAPTSAPLRTMLDGGPEVPMAEAKRRAVETFLTLLQGDGSLPITYNCAV
jgi:hypothetical protein